MARQHHLLHRLVSYGVSPAKKYYVTSFGKEVVTTAVKLHELVNAPKSGKYRSALLLDIVLKSTTSGLMSQGHPLKVIVLVLLSLSNPIDSL